MKKMKTQTQKAIALASFIIAATSSVTAHAAMTQAELVALESVTGKFSLKDGVGFCSSDIAIQRDYMEHVLISSNGSTRGEITLGYNRHYTSNYGIVFPEHGTPGNWKNESYLDSKGYLTVVSRKFEKSLLGLRETNPLLLQVSIKRLSNGDLRYVHYLADDMKSSGSTTSTCLYEPTTSPISPISFPPPQAPIQVPVLADGPPTEMGPTPAPQDAPARPADVSPALTNVFGSPVAPSTRNPFEGP